MTPNNIPRPPADLGKCTEVSIRRFHFLVEGEWIALNSVRSPACLEDHRCPECDGPVEISGGWAHCTGPVAPPGLLIEWQYRSWGEGNGWGFVYRYAVLNNA